jgi:hypothetical protein
MNYEKDVVSFTKDKLDRFKKVYDENKGKGKLTAFEFEERKYVVGYAKYLIEYLEERFKDERSLQR